MDANEVLNQMQRVASDDEADMIERLAIKAGFWWKCKRCEWVGVLEEGVCDNCELPQGAEAKNEEG